MTKEFVLQDPGEGLHEAEISEVHVAEGDDVEEDDLLLTVETDKVSVEIPSPFDGTIEDLRVEVGDQVRVGEVLMTYDEAGDGSTTDEEDASEEESVSKEESAKDSDEGEDEAAEKGKAPKESDEVDEDADRPIPAAPATRRLAHELDLDLASIEGSGPEGRVTEDDVRAAADGEDAAKKKTEKKTEKKTADSKWREPVPFPHMRTPELPDFERFGPVERQPLRGVRRVTAERMAIAASQTAAVTHHDVADVTELEDFRRRHREQIASDGGRLTPTAFVMKATVAALKEFPRFNASIDVDAEEIVLKHHYHLGVAVDTDRGLLVPVIRDVDRKSLRQLAVELVEVSERTRDGKAEREGMLGGTFTITNPGGIGGTAFTPIVNWPQVAILGMARTRLDPVIRGDVDDHEVVARLRMPLALTFDHRVVDGAEAARFMRFLIERLESPDALVLDA